MITDKSLRMSSKQLSVFIYDLIDYNLVYLVVVLEAADGDAWSDVLTGVLGLVNALLESQYLNLYLIKRRSKASFGQFIYALQENLIRNYKWA